MAEVILFPDGKLALRKNGQTFIKESYVGRAICGETVYTPTKLDVDQNVITLQYPCGEVKLSLTECDGYHKLTLLSIPENATNFVFGPYATNADTFGEILGAAWYEDGSAACIQSLMPKVEGGVPNGKIANAATAAAQGADGVTLQCSVTDRTKPTVFDHLGYKNALVKPVPGPDGRMEGAAVALIAAENAEQLLDIISNMELAEGLPHPMFKGSYAKRDPRASGIYMIFEGSGVSAEQRIELAKRAGISCVYLADVFERWGHFPPNTGSYPGGIEELRAMSEKAWADGITLGIHTLSNFIHTTDEYVTPVPHEKLLVMDETVLTAPLGETDTVIYVRDANNFARYDMNVVRLGDELIEYERFNERTMCLTGCRRGAYGTKIGAYEEGCLLSRLWCHGYRTLFPDVELQEEMADNLARFIKACGIHRLSFDGLEGCSYNGTDQYGPAAYVRRVYEKVGSDLISDASIPGHYLWHSNAYYNWGEPWYDHVRRGGMHHYRVMNGAFFRRNLIPPMMGWYIVASCDGKYEATTPENFEFAVSRSAAFNAGLAVNFCDGVIDRHGYIEEFADMIRIWEDFRYRADIPQDVLLRLQEETGNWHLEKQGRGWLLTERILRHQDLSYGDREIKTEAGAIYRKEIAAADGLVGHCSRIMLDAPYGEKEEKIHFRIRVGHPGHGHLEDLAITRGFADEELTPDALRFKVTAEGGDYLEYRGGNELYHMDPHFKLKEVVHSDGSPIVLQSCKMDHVTVTYLTDEDPLATYMVTEIRRRNEFYITEK